MFGNGLATLHRLMGSNNCWCLSFLALW